MADGESCIFKCKFEIAEVLPGGLGRGASPNKNLRLASKVGCESRRSYCRRAQAGQHNEAGSEPRTSWRGPLHRNQRDFWYFWSQKYVQRANTVRPYTAHDSLFNNLQIIKQNSTIQMYGAVCFYLRLSSMYFLVTDFSLASISCGVPLNSTCPPFKPPSGPISII